MKAPDSRDEDRELLSMDDSSDSVTLQSALSIMYDGSRYYYYGQYRYDNSQCAIDYAERQGARSGGAVPETPMPIHSKSNAPSSMDQDLMLSAGVSFAKGIYHFEEYRYDKLDGALAFSALMGARRGVVKPEQRSHARYWRMNRSLGPLEFPRKD